MPEQLKNFFDRRVVESIAGDLARVHKPFDRAAFVRECLDGLDRLELTGRGWHIAEAMRRHLPERYEEAAGILVKSLGPELGGLSGMEPFKYLPHVFYVAKYGIDHLDLSMRAQYELTKRFSAEASIRPFIAKDPERTFAVLREWTSDPNAHVRRLVSEGTRLRLPWAMRVAWLDANPERVLALLDLLKDDPTTLVRRSVANNLNDLGKVHRDLLVRTCAAWLDGASPERRALVEHALRSAVKRGERDALKLLGYGQRASVAIEDCRLAPRKVAIGGSVSLSFVLRSTSASPQDVLVDFAVHFVKANGRAAPKVFKLKRIALPARGRVPLRARISLAVHTTRKPRPGTHAVDVRVNGVAKRAGSFVVTLAERSPC